MSSSTRTKGAAFTVMVIVTATILLSVGGAFVDATRNLTRHAGTADRLEVAKEALAGSIDAARADVSGWPRTDQRTSTATLKLSRATVTLKLEAHLEGIACEAVARVEPDVVLGATFLLVHRQDRWIATRYAVKAVK